MSKRINGSVKNKITAPEILAERAKCNFDKEEMIKIFWGNDKKAYD